MDPTQPGRSDLPHVAAALAERAAAEPERTVLTWLGPDGAEAERLSAAALDRRARQIAAALRREAPAGARVLLVCPPGLDYVAGFFGCLYGGLVAVPAAPPDPARPERALGRLRGLCRDASPAVALTTRAALPLAQALAAPAPELAALPWLAADAAPAAGEGAGVGPVDEGEVVFLQYTSGSTSAPRGVLVGSRCLAHNLREIRDAFGFGAASVMVSWLPPYHDMGLIGGILAPIYTGGAAVLMAPATFLQEPVRWLEAIGRYGGTISGGPDFGYALCARRIREADRARLDLRAWEVAFSGAEPIRHATLERFADAFAPRGFRREALLGCYGLAEATLMVAAAERGRAPAVAWIDGAALEAGRVAPARQGEARARALVGSGRGGPERRLVVVDPEALHPAEAGRVGEIWVAGPSVALGYWGRPEETGATFGAALAGAAARRDAAHLRTGDLGFVDASGELFVVGRIKDLIVARGRNLYPQDLEAAAERSHPAVRPGCVAAFGVDDGARERIVVAAEVRDAAAARAAGLAVRDAIAAEHDVAVDEVVLLGPRVIPKTSSGKIQRRACRDAYRAGALAVVAAVGAEDVPAEGTPRPGDPRDPADVERWLQARAGLRLGRPAAEVDPERPLALLGLDSVGALDLAGEIEEALGVRGALPHVLDAPGLRGLAGWLAAAAGADAPVARATMAGPVSSYLPPGAGAGARDAAASRELPLSHAQRALWLLEQRTPGSGAYHIAGAARVVGGLDVGAFERALAGLVERHPALRCTFAETDDGPIAQLGAGGAIALRCHDASGWSDARLAAHLGDRAEAPFDLARGPIARVELARRSAEQHVLLLAMHHVAGDFRSVAVLLRDLAALYRAERSGAARDAPPLPPAGEGHQALVDREARALAGARGAELAAYWRRALAGCPPLLRLPTDRPRREGAPAGTRALRLGPELTAGLRRVARARGATPFVALLAALQALLSRISGQRQLVLGAPATLRRGAAERDVVGCFVNTLALRADLSGDPSFEELVDRARRTVQDALAHRDYPFSRLVEDLRPERAPGAAPLVQVLLTWYGASAETSSGVDHVGDASLVPLALGAAGPRLAWGDLALEPFPLERRSTQVDLAFFAGELGDDLLLVLRHDSRLFRAETAAALLEHLRALLRGAIADPSARVAALPLLDDAERRRVVAACRAPERAFAPECLHRLVARRAAERPEATAVELYGQRTSYGALVRRARRLAARLRAHGVGPEARVAVCLERSPALPIALLAALFAGGAFVPLDVELPPERIAQILDDAAPRALITRPELLDRAHRFPGPVVLLGHDDGDEDPPGDAILDGGVDPESAAYVVYTSGSTGAPKGVVVPHRAIVHHLAARQALYPLGASDRMLHKAPIGFDIGVWELFGPLVAGAEVVLARPGGQRDAAYLARLVAEAGITVLHAGPGLLRVLLEEPLDGAAALGRVFVGGEALTPEIAARFFEKLRHVRLTHQYGPTEATVDVTFWDCDPAAGAERIPIGRPLASTQLYVLDERLEPQPIGVPGELYIGGPSLARGYFGRPDFTAERFVPDALSGAPGARLYRTGDVARVLEGGIVELCGRLDRQVKIRGHRVELDEIEAALSRHPAVRAAAVTAAALPDGDLQLTAYVVLEPAAAPDPAALRAFLRQALPEPMVPAAFVPLDALPRTPSGKIDRAALPAAPGACEAASATAPRTATERQLAAIWSEVLGVGGIGADDDFFARGGHSLRAAQVAARVRRVLGVELPVNALFEAPTLAALARRIERARPAPEDAGPEADGIRPATRRGPAPLSFAQERVWFLAQLDPGGAAYHLAEATRISGPLNAAALERALAAIVARHEILRSTFRRIDGQAFQAPADPARFALRSLDLAGAPDPEQMTQHVITEEATLPFDLAGGHPFRAALVRLGAEQHVLVLAMHHLVADGWSVGVFLRELAALYGAFAAGRPSPLPPLPIQYADYAAWQRARAAGEGAARALAAWRARLAGAPAAIDLPTDPPAPSPFAPCARALPAALTASLNELARRSGATPFHLLLAAFGVLLGRLSGQTDLVVGAPAADRRRLETEPLVGLFLDVLPLRLDLSGDPTFAGVIARAREAALFAEAHREVPFERVVAKLAPARHAGRAPLFDVVLNVTNVPRPGALRLDGLTLAPLALPPPEPKYTLTLYAEERRGRLTLSLAARHDRISARRAALLLEQLEHLLAQAASDPARPIADLSLVAPSSRSWLPDPAAPLPAPAVPTVVDAVLAQAAADPDRLAVEAADKRWSYGALGATARAVAAALADRGVRPGDVVAVTGAPSFGLVAALLGALCARAVVAPVDPELPAARRALLFDVARARCCVRVGAGDGDAALHIELDVDPEPDVSAAAPAFAGPPPCPDDAAYVFFTSGTTGRPKAVLGVHRGLGHFTAWEARRFGVGPGDRVAWLTGLSFDVVLRDVFTPLSAGAALVVPERADALPTRVLGFLARARVTLLHAVPTLVEAWLEHAPAGAALPDLRWVLFAGEPLGDALVRRFRAAIRSAAALVNLYGPTETTLAKCFHVLGPEPLPGVQPVGAPLPDAQALVLSSRRAPCGVGETGEIVIRTPLRTRGYLDAPDETARRFFPNPFREDPDDLCYATGDLGRFRPDGLLEIRGRLDDEVKIAGVRVAPAEVNAALAAHPAVAASAVVARRNAAGTQTLVAYFVPAAREDGAAGEPGALAAWLGARLPRALVPSAFVPLDALPRTPSGKLDPRALPAPAAAADPDAAPLAMPAPGLEAALADLWRRVLGAPRVGARDDFFALGGHSLAALTLASLVLDTLGVELPVRAVFEHPRLADLAAEIARLRDETATRTPAAAGGGALVLDPAERHAPFPLTDTQAAFWAGRSGDFALGDIATHAYREIAIDGLDVGRIEAAFRKLVARHPMLRAVVRADGQQQVLAEVPPYVIRVLDLRDCPPCEATAAALAVREEMAHAAAPTDRWPLFDLRASLLPGGRARLHVRLDALLVDAWSSRILAAELWDLHEDPDLALPPLSLTFRDYVLATIRFRDSDAYRRAERAWRDRLATLPPAPALPGPSGLDRPTRPRFARHSARLDPARFEALAARARAAGLTPSALLLAAYAEVLAAFSRHRRFTVNVTSFNRRAVHPDVASLVGNFSASLLVEVDASGGGAFTARARRVQAELVRDLDAGLVSGAAVLRQLGRARGEPGAAAMPVVFTSVLGLPGAAPRGPRRPPTIAYAITASSQVTLNHGAGEADGELVLHWDALEGAFPPGFVDDLVAEHVALITRLADDPAAWDLAPAELLPLAQHRALAASVNATIVPRPAGLLHEGFLAQAAARPDARAVVSSRRTLSYGDLARRARALAAALRRRGVAPGELVAVVLDKGWEQVVAVLGILCAGAAYLPLDPALPATRLRSLLGGGRVRCAVTDAPRDATLAWPDGVVRLRVPDGAPAEDGDAPITAVRPDALAYVIYTSGSTGVPKGVMIDHRGAENTIADVNARFEVGPGDRVLGLSSLGFDLSVYDVFGTLAAGATLVLPDAAGARDPAHWLSWLERERVTVWSSVPALLEMLLDARAGAPPCEAAPLAALRVVLLSGDWIPVTLPDRLRAAAPRARVVSLGGATEASIWSVLYPIDRVDPAWRSLPYGRPMANQTLHVLRDDLTPCPTWVPGELHIGGVGVAKGYLGDPERTRASFVTHPALGVLYRTGDVARLLPDGNFELLGREDAQVKLRGHRIELGEIEATLAHHPEVREAVAAVVQPPGGERRLYAWVVGRGGRAPEADLRAYLGARLPAYMVPAAVIPIDAIPLSTNGKVDRARLPRPAPVAAPAAGSAPRAGVEATLARLWAEVLQIPEAPRDASFFDLGGDSVLAVLLVGRARSAGLRLSVRQILEHPTIAALAPVVTWAAAERRGAEGAALEPPFPLTPVQQWFFAQGFEDAHHWNQAAVLEVRRRADAAAIERALGALVAHHDALRTRFFQGEGGAQQAYGAPEGARGPLLRRVDLAALDEAAQQTAIAEASAAAQASLDLAEGPLLRAVLFDLGPSRPARLLVVIHHLVVDAVSWRVLFDDLTRIWPAIEAGDPPRLPPKTASYAAWARRLTALAGSAALDEARRFWTELPARGARPLPVDFPGGDNTMASERRVAVALSARETEALLRGAPQWSTAHVEGVLLTAFTQALATWTGDRSVWLALEAHGRELPSMACHEMDLDVSRTVGWFTSIFPILLELEPGSSAGAALGAIAAQLGRIPDRGLGYGMLRWLSPDGDLRARLAALPWPEISFDYLGRMDPPPGGAPAFVWTRDSPGPTRAPRGRRRDVLEVRAVIAGGTLETTFTYSERLHRRETMTRVAGDYLEGLRALLAGGAGRSG